MRAKLTHHELVQPEFASVHFLRTPLSRCSHTLRFPQGPASCGREVPINTSCLFWYSLYINPKLSNKSKFLPVFFSEAPGLNGQETIKRPSQQPVAYPL